MMRLHKTDGSKPMVLPVVEMDNALQFLYKRGELPYDWEWTMPGQWTMIKKYIQSLEALLKEAREKNVKQNLMLGKLQKKLKKSK